MADQFVPNGGLDFDIDRIALLELLHSRVLDVSRVYSATAINPYPWLVTSPELADLLRVGLCVQKAIRAIIENYFSDSRLRELVAVDDKVEALLLAASATEYRTGAIRPDFLHDAHGRLLVCEVNCRFPLNGFLISHLLDAAFNDSKYAERLGTDFQRVPGLAEVPIALQEAFGDAEQVVVLKGEEHGYDSTLLVDFWSGCREAPPAAARDFDPMRDFMLLELHQHELLAHAATLAPWIRTGRCLNDVRTIFLGHDKRLLAVFTSGILADYLPSEDVTCLYHHIVPTYVVGRSPDVVKRARERRKEWVLKPNLFGKGQGILVGRNVAADAWIAALGAAPNEYVLQKYVNQQWFNILTGVAGGQIPMHVVGLLPVYEQRCLGSGIYRASPQDIVNVAGGGVILAPIVVPNAKAETNGNEAYRPHYG